MRVLTPKKSIVIGREEGEHWQIKGFWKGIIGLRQ